MFAGIARLSSREEGYALFIAQGVAQLAQKRKQLEMMTRRVSEFFS